MIVSSGLPAYFVLVARDGRKVILKWSDCNHKVQNSTSTYPQKSLRKGVSNH